MVSPIVFGSTLETDSAFSADVAALLAQRLKAPPELPPPELPPPAESPPMRPQPNGSPTRAPTTRALRQFIMCVVSVRGGATCSTRRKSVYEAPRM